MNKVSPVTWVLITIAIITCLVSIWYFKNFTVRTKTYDHGYSEAARRNPFLAAENFLKLREIEVETRNNFQLFDDAISADDTVIINSSRLGMSSQQQAKMKEWVNDGGHLVLLATEQYDYSNEASKDSFLDSLGLRYYLSDEWRFEDEERIAHLEFTNYKDKTQVRFYGDGYIEDTSGDASFIGGTEFADQVIQYSLGQGLVTVAIDFDIWKNRNIEKHDHAMLLAQLVGDSKKAWLIFNRHQPSLLNLAWQYGPTTVITTFIILFLTLFSAAWRVGAKRKDQLPINREIIQHIAAAAEFNYRIDSGEKLVDDLKNIVFKKMSIVNLGFNHLDAKLQLEKISQHTGIDINQLSLVMNAELDSEEKFIAKIKLLQKIRTLL